ncbi:MAG: thiamine pyrophosphate-requiring protein [Caldilineaceae bacterium SB0664_bin_27]|uniref:Thiamine pyrophosphate-requiring protein n=1 Tax=Caldilineaceae bacterium SB0664_bin_27 TaxID=2605260 RepID=A0A6B0YN13_9CHLR|nr:thiamine pyrophosphate-requiring protein [Caldilineaceae bacterium SB0664_bin_27]
MQVVDAIAHCLKEEGTEILFAYPVNYLIESAAELDIRTIIVRQERIGLHMADAISRLSSGDKIGVFCMQSGPGSENAYGGVAQAFGDSSPIVVLPGGYARPINQVQPNFNSAQSYAPVTKSSEQLIMPEMTSDAIRRAFQAVRSGRPRPALVEIPADIASAEVEDFSYTPVKRLRYGPDPADVERAADMLVAAERPVIYAGQGVHYAKGWDALKELAELLEAPVTTTLNGKSAFPETHPLSLGSANRSHAKAVADFLNDADVIFGIGCSFSITSFGVRMPAGKTIIHATLDPADVNKDVVSQHALVGDADLTLRALIAAVSDRLGGQPRGRQAGVAARIAEINGKWEADWAAKLNSDEAPLSPYRVIRDLYDSVDVANTIITHDAGSPRDQLSPFWKSITPLSYIGWGKTTQLGYGLGLAMGAKLACPDKLCINVWGDAAIGFTGMDFETAVRERIPILSVLFNNFSMAIEIPIMPVSQEKYGATDISGNYAKMAEAFGGYGERIETPDQIIPAIERGIRKTEEGVPALLEFITAKETEIPQHM